MCVQKFQIAWFCLYARRDGRVVMQRPAKPSTPVRFRLPPPLSNSSQHSTTSSAGPTPQASEKASLAFADNAKDEAVAVSVAPDLDALGADPLRPYGGSWRATLSFSVASRPYGDGTRSILSNAEHFGPLRLQKPLWPEGRHPVHLLLLHPPGGSFCEMTNFASTCSA